MLSRRLLIIAMITGLVLLAYASSNSQKVPSAYMIAETQADLPGKWEMFPQERYDERIKDKYVQHAWMGRRMNPNEPASQKNNILVASFINIYVYETHQLAKKYVEAIANGGAIRMSSGTYSGLPLGDLCFRSKSSDSGVALVFCRANVAYKISIKGPEHELDYPTLTEKLARSLVARADAALDLATTGIPVSSNQERVGVRRPKGVPVQLVDDWMIGKGVDCKPEWEAGLVTLRRGNRVLVLKVGQTDAELDAKPIKLPFPALRYGKDRIWCPEETLQKLMN